MMLLSVPDAPETPAVKQAKARLHDGYRLQMAGDPKGALAACEAGLALVQGDTTPELQLRVGLRQLKVEIQDSQRRAARERREAVEERVTVETTPGEARAETPATCRECSQAFSDDNPAHKGPRGPTSVCKRCVAEKMRVAARERVARNGGLACPTAGNGQKPAEPETVEKPARCESSDGLGAAWGQAVTGWAEPTEDLQSCGHPRTAITGSDEGKNYYGACADYQPHGEVVNEKVMPVVGEGESQGPDEDIHAWWRQIMGSEPIVEAQPPAQATFQPELEWLREQSQRAHAALDAEGIPDCADGGTIGAGLLAERIERLATRLTEALEERDDNARKKQALADSVDRLTVELAKLAGLFPEYVTGPAECVERLREDMADLEEERMALLARVDSLTPAADSIAPLSREHMRWLSLAAQQGVISMPKPESPIIEQAQHCCEAAIEAAQAALGEQPTGR